MQRKRGAAFVPLSFVFYSVDLKPALYPMRRMSASHAMSLWLLRWRKAKRQIFSGKYYAGVITQCIVFSAKLAEPEFDRLAYPCIFAKGI
ncbi:hypothetical protein [Dysgonomonas alginatilytica]|uniref:hypothetical protein n=1 Tax=Dysgonomonas alginatilytica TaxID=1605892 RepID=UPI000D75AB48|nr:hypothetical protein [Dysgonomonas alginatilytica]